MGEIVTAADGPGMELGAGVLSMQVYRGREEGPVRVHG